MKTLAIVYLLIGALSLQGCTYVPAVEATDLSVLNEETVTRSEIEAVIGEPLQSRNTYEGSVNAYLYDRGAEGGVEGLDPGSGCGGDPVGCLVVALLIQPFVWASTPFLYANKVDEQEGHLVIVYSADNTVIRYRRVTTDGNIDLLIGREVEQAQLKMRAEDGDPDAMYEYAKRLQIGTGSERIKWYCLAAHAGHVKAQNQFGRYHHYGYVTEKDLVQAHVWYSLSLEAEDSREVARQREKLKGEMTSDEVVEADRLMAEWRPNPAVCAAIAAQAKN